MSPARPTIAIAGRIESGKSSVSSLLSARLGMPVLSFGDFIRTTCPPGAPREELQAAGAQLLDEIGPSGLVGAVLESRGLDTTTPVIWEGVRHLNVLEALRGRYAPDPVELFFLSPPEARRLARAEQTAGSRGRRNDWEAHETEATDALAEAARMTITASTAEGAVAEILAELDRLA
jgi:adenylate kinase family enzyme